MLLDWAYDTRPMRDFANAVTLEQAQAAGQIDRAVELVTRKVYGGPNAATLDVLEAFRDLAYHQKVLGIIGPSLPDDMAACAADFDRAWTSSMKAIRLSPGWSRISPPALAGVRSILIWRSVTTLGASLPAACR